MTRSYGLRRWPFWVFLGVVVLGAAFYFDAAAQAWVTQHQVPAVRTFMRSVTGWGDWPTHVVIGLAGAGVCYAKGNRAWVTIFAAMVIACAVAGSVNRVVKVASGRARPSVKVDAGWNGPRFNSKYNAFPSGHAASSTAFFTTLCLAQRRIGLALLPIPILIAASRLYLNAHHLSDVVAGAILGVLCAILVWKFLSQRPSAERSEKCTGPPSGR